MPNLTITELSPTKTYNLYVEMGQDLSTYYKNVRMQIAKLALEVCNLRYGNNPKNPPLFTLKQYSEDIGIAYNTLRIWTKLYSKVYQHLTPEQQEEIISSGSLEGLKIAVSKIPQKRGVSISVAYNVESQKSKHSQYIMTVNTKLQGLLNCLKYCKLDKKETELMRELMDEITTSLEVLDR